MKIWYYNSMSSTVTKDDKNYTPVIIWLGVVCAMVALMIVVGGITRLTESGLCHHCLTRNGNLFFRHTNNFLNIN
jgi:hypothetical protein